MINRRVLLSSLLLLPSLVSQPAAAQPSRRGRPTSSAGIYDSNDKLVRKLWSAELNHPHVTNPAAAWDGRLDDGSVAPTGSYVAKVIQHNFQYTWEGVIGNTSPNHLNNLDYHNYSTAIKDMAITNNHEIYFSHGYDERWNTAHVTTEDNIQNAKYVHRFRDTQRDVGSCCSDGTITYFSRNEGTISYVWGVFCADYQIPNNPGVKQFVNFSSGTLIRSEWVGIGVGTDQFPLDVTVQKTGSFLYISRIQSTGPNVYSIWTLDKTTGQHLQTNLLGYNLQLSIANNPVDKTLWVIHSTGGVVRDKISKLSVNGSGALTETGVHITGLSDAYNMEVSPDGSMLLVIDLGSQQIKAFNTSDGSIKTAWGTSGVLGPAGGYVGSPAVTDNKFMFRTDHWFSFGGGYIAFSSDGSFWVGDGGNYRDLHFSSGNSPTVLERIHNHPSFYAVHECRGDPTRIFGDFLEYRIDYNQPLGIGNGSWKLINNWFNLIAPLANEGFSTLKWIGVYSNGRTYAAHQNTFGKWSVLELTSTGLRDTGKQIVLDGYLDRDMNIWMALPLGAAGGDIVQFKKNAFTGFDGSNNPTWASDPSVAPTTTVLTSETLPALFPGVFNLGSHPSNFVEPLSNGVIPVFRPDSAHTTNQAENHFGGIHSVTGKVMFMNHPPTPPNNGGANTLLKYPEFKTSFPVGYNPNPTGLGSGVTQNGGGIMVYEPGDSFLFTSYPGEGWGSNQTNMWYHWHESGLLVDRFGVAAPFFGLSRSRNPRTTLNDGIDINSLYPNGFTAWKGLAGLAGNAFSGGLTFVNGKYYIYHNDEWYHGGIHRWRVDGLETFQVLSYSVPWNAANYDGTPDPYNLLDGLPFSEINLPNNTAGWVRNPTSNVLTSYGVTWFRLYTNGIQCDRLDPPDLVFEANGTAVDYTAYKNLTRVHTGNWTLDCIVAWPSAGFARFLPPSTQLFNLFFDVLDSTGKIIARFYNANHEKAGGGFGMYLNENRMLGMVDPTNSDHWAVYCGDTLPLVLTANVGGGTLSATYGDLISIPGVSVYEAGANIADPARVRLTFHTDPAAAGPYMLFTSFTQMNFIE